MSERCLYCYHELSSAELDFHTTCSRKIFAVPEPPVLDYTESEMLKLGDQVIKSHIAVTGVQPKLSLAIEKLANADMPRRFTIVGLWGAYILKPPAKATDL